MNVRDTLYAISEAGLTLKASKTINTLKVYPAENLSSELASAIREHKADIIRILRKDEEIQRTGVIKSERHVFELAREYFDLDKPGGVA